MAHKPNDVGRVFLLFFLFVFLSDMFKENMTTNYDVRKEFPVFSWRVVKQPTSINWPTGLHRPGIHIQSNMKNSSPPPPTPPPPSNHALFMRLACNWDTQQLAL